MRKLLPYTNPSVNPHTNPNPNCKARVMVMATVIFRYFNWIVNFVNLFLFQDHFVVAVSI